MKIYTHFDSGGMTFVFSVDEVFSYSLVDRRWIIPVGPNGRLSNSAVDDDDVVVVVVVADDFGLAGLELANF